MNCNLTSFFFFFFFFLFFAGIEECNLQTMVDQVNTEQESFGERQLYVQAINRSLGGSDPHHTLQVSQISVIIVAR